MLHGIEALACQLLGNDILHASLIGKAEFSQQPAQWPPFLLLFQQGDAQLIRADQPPPQELLSQQR